MTYGYFRRHPNYDPDDPAEQEPWNVPGGGSPALSDRYAEDDTPTPSFDEDSGNAEDIAATKAKLKELVADERYWRHRDPVFVADVTKAFEAAYSDAGYDATGKLRRTKPRPINFGAFDGAEPAKTRSGAASNHGGTDGADDLLWRGTAPPTRNLRYDPGTDKPRIMLADDRSATGDILAERPKSAIEPKGRDPKDKENKAGSNFDEKLFGFDLDNPNVEQSAAGQEKPRGHGTEERNKLEREVNEEVLEFRRKTRGLGLPYSAEIEVFLNASKSRGILSNGLFDAIRSGFHKRDPADRLPAARALAEAHRLFPDEASASFERQELAFAREVERLGADPKLAGDPERLIDLATEAPELRYFRHAYSLVDGGIVPRAGRATGLGAALGAALGAMTRKPGCATGGPGKATPPRDPRTPPLGEPRSFPKELTERLDHIKSPEVRGAVGQILQGATPDRLNTPHFAKDYVAYKSGGYMVGIRDYWRAVQRAGGDWTKIETREPGVFKYTAPDGTRITYRRKTDRHDPTNEIHIEWGGKKPTNVKVRYE